MKTLTFAFAAILALGAAVPAVAQTTPPKDTGNMAYPAPLPQGNVGTTNTTGTPRKPTDTGSVGYPAPAATGAVGSTSTAGAPRTPTDTGNMAYPAPLPQGNVGSAPVKK